MKIQLTAAEMNSRQLSPENLMLAVNLVKANGCVIIESAYDEGTINKWKEAYMQLLDKHVAENGVSKTGINFDGQTGNVRMDLPFAAPFLDSNFIADPLTLSIVDRVVGKGCGLLYFASNTAMPGGTVKQKVHSDGGPLFEESRELSLPIYHLVVNIPLVDFHEGNGPTEIWPGGTHLNPDHFYSKENAHVMQSLAEKMHYEKVIMPRGSILIRDIRMWHRGTPNQSSEPRPNLAMIYGRNWDKASAHLKLSQADYDQLTDRAQEVLRFASIR